MVHHGHQHVLVPATRKSRARNGISAARSNGRRAAARRPPPAGLPASRWHQRPASRSRPAQPAPPAAADPLDRREQRAQTLLAAHHIGQRRPQRLGIQAPAQPQRHRHVVNRGRPLQLLDKPQPGLGKRQRHHRGPHTATTGGSPPAAPDPRRQLGHRGRLEHARTPTPASRPVLIAATRRIADSESPPRSKNESSTPTRSSPSTWA